VGVPGRGCEGAPAGEHASHRPVVSVARDHGGRLRWRDRRAGGLHATGPGRRAVPRALPPFRILRLRGRRRDRGLLQPRGEPELAERAVGRGGRAVPPPRAVPAGVPHAPAGSRGVPLLLHLQQQQPHQPHPRDGRAPVRGVRHAARARRPAGVHAQSGRGEEDAHAEEKDAHHRVATRSLDRRDSRQASRARAKKSPRRRRASAALRSPRRETRLSLSASLSASLSVSSTRSPRRRSCSAPRRTSFAALGSGTAPSSSRARRRRWRRRKKARRRTSRRFVRRRRTAKLRRR